MNIDTRDTSIPKVILIGLSVKNRIDSLPPYQDNLQGLIDTVETSLGKNGWIKVRSYIPSRVMTLAKL